MNNISDKTVMSESCVGQYKGELWLLIHLIVNAAGDRGGPCPQYKRGLQEQHWGVCCGCGQGSGLRECGHSGVHCRHRQRGVLLHGDEHPPAGANGFLHAYPALRSLFPIPLPQAGEAICSSVVQTDCSAHPSICSSHDKARMLSVLLQQPQWVL